MKEYNFKIKMICKGLGYVTANNLEEAKKKIEKEQWEDVYDQIDLKYGGEIIEISEEEL